MFESVRHVVSPKFRRAERVLAKRYFGKLKTGDPIGIPITKRTLDWNILQYSNPRVKRIGRSSVTVEGGS